MRPVDDPPQICRFCTTRPAIVRYTHARSKIDEMVCARCLDVMEARDALEDRLIHIWDLVQNERYDEAMACLDEILEANRHRDHDRWLARSIARDRAIILGNAGRHAEAEEACKAWADLGFYDVGQRWMHGVVTAETLEALGRPKEGLAALEDALSHQERRFVPGALSHLVRVAEMSKKLGQPVDPKWRSLAEEMATWHGMALPERVSLGEAILELYDAIDKADRARRGEPEDDNEDEHDDP